MSEVFRLLSFERVIKVSYKLGLIIRTFKLKNFPSILEIIV